MTGEAAVRGIRKVDVNGKIGFFSMEPDRPYKRPPPSRSSPKKQITDERGNVHTYCRLLLATGCTPRRFGFGGDNLIYYRALTDYRMPRELTGQR